MQFDGKSPDGYTLGSVLRMCTSLGLLLRGEQIHGFTVKTGFDLDVGVVNGLLAMYAQCKHISEAEYLFRTLPCDSSRELHSYTIFFLSQRS